MGASLNQAYPILLAGGIGSRLWPVSRERYPKQLAKLIGNDSLLQSTVKRLTPHLNPERLRVVCGQAHHHIVRRHLQEIQISPEGIIITEPCGRNTAPAILLAVLNVSDADPEAILCIFPADHIIQNTQQFHQQVTTAVSLADQGHIVTFGILPQYPETGYGYIEGGAPVAEGALLTKRFVEKPDRETAESYLAAGNFFWNSGMFAFKASVILEEFKRYQWSLWDQMRKLDRSGTSIAEGDYRKLPNISIDYAIMEATKKCVVLPSDFGWSDIGTWKSLYEWLPKDLHLNVIDGDVIAHNTDGCLILGHRRLIVANGLADMVIVDTADSTFISNLEDSRDVKYLVGKLKQKGRREYQQHLTVDMPWGSRTLLERSTDVCIERLEIAAAAACDWKGPQKGVTQLTVVKGAAVIEHAGESLTLYKGDTTDLIHDAAATIRNMSTEDWLTVVCIHLAGC